MNIRLFDLHCDTASRCIDQNKDLLKNDIDIDLFRGTKFEKWVQVFACFIHDDFKEQQSFFRFMAQYNFIVDMINKNSDKMCLYNPNDIKNNMCNAMISIESGSAINNNIENVKRFADMGVKMITLTWNDANSIAGGCFSEQDFTSFGKQVVKEMNNNNIIVDVSHLNDKSFYTLCEISDKSFIATHSNSRKICNHRRNLTDEQIKEIVRRNGLIGINYAENFLNENKANFKDFLNHIENMLSLGGQDVVCLGSDFDGAPLPECLKEISCNEQLYLELSKVHSNDIVEKIMFDNANNYFLKN